HDADFTFDQPFHLSLAEDQRLFAENIVRIIPGKRLVAFGVWQDKSVVAKLFFDPKHAKRHVEKELAGLKALRDNKIPTPALYYNGWSEDKRVYVLLFERIFESKSLDEIWQEKESTESLLPLMQAIIKELATQHVLGVMQHDLHLKNFLITRKRIYTLDAAQIELFPSILSKKQSMENLALFLSQLGVGVEEHQKILFQYYAKVRGWLLKKEDIVEIFLLIKKWNDERWRQFEKKIFRSSSRFERIRDLSTFGMYDRRYAYPELMEFLDWPEAVFDHPTAVTIKAGRSATVIKVVLDQRELVIKRYNIKNLWHRLRRCLQTTRAFNSWRLAQKLCLFGVNTAKPVAFIEKRYAGFRGQSYYVTEYVAGEQANEYFQQRQAQEEKITDLVKQITTLLKNLSKLDITHGDLKITNILVDNDQHPVLIDLDGAVEHASLSSLRSAWRKEIKRLMKNFRDQPLIREKFNEYLF
ncbi:MAG: hypothetical protein EPO11_06350, partial [Gammaproteobacteria bacterium]